MLQRIQILIDCDNAYYNGDDPIMSDYDYDKYKTKARELHPNDPYFQTVGATPQGDKVDLPYVLGSLEKMKFDGSMNQWLQDTGITELAISDKLDGCTIYVEYEGGEVIHATTRGNGYQGHDITEKAKIFCPKSSFIGNFHLKGEVLATTQVAHSLDYKKSRTFVAGCLNRDGIRNAEHLEVVFYQVLDRDYETYGLHIETIESFGLPVVSSGLINVKNIEGDVETFLADYYKERKELSRWDIDGLVIVDNLNPNHTDEYYPENAVAFKVNEDAVQAIVTHVSWDVKRSGKVQPIVNIEPVDISGSTVTKATGFNMAFIRDNGIGKGAEIGIVLSGEIIPYITDVYKEGIVDNPTKCPSCDAKLGHSASGVDLVCLNPDCEGKSMYWIENFLLSNGVEEVTAITIRKFGVSSIYDLLELDELDMVLDGFGASRATTIVNQIKKVYQTTPANLLKSFGINGLGKTMSADLIGHFGDIESVFQATKHELIQVDGIGDIMTDRLLKELPSHFPVYDYLIENGLKFKEKEGDALKGKKITLTGKSEIKRNDLKKAIESQGGMVKGISKSVDMLFTNSPDSTTVKMKKARDYGIEINGYDKLYELLGMSV